MKRLAALLIILLLPAAVRAQEEGRAVPSAISHVTVYERGARVTRVADAPVPVGTSVLRFTGVSPHLNPESIQVSAEGDFMILSVAHRNDYLDEPRAALPLLDRRRTVQDSLASAEALLEVYRQEESMLLANKSIGGAQTGVDVAALRAAAEFFRSRLSDIKNRQLALQDRIRRLQEDLAALDNQINEVRAARSEQPSGEILVTVQTNRAARGHFTIDYTSPAAGWYPHYDVRVERVMQPLDLVYYANVYQSTGEPWENVALTLSTGDPSASGVRPELYPWRVNFYEPNLYRRSAPRKVSQPGRILPGSSVKNPSTLQGRVTSYSGEALPGVAIVIADLNIGAVTDANGRYLISGIPPGLHTVSTSYLGYAQLIGPLSSDQIDFVLGEDYSVGEEVVITGGRETALEMDASMEVAPAAMPVPVQTRVRATTVQFDIAVPYTIPPDGRPNTVRITEYTVPAQYTYYAAPRAEPVAFLTALLTDWEDLHLLPGEANLFFEGMYVGRAPLDASEVSDTLVISLGRDRSVVVERKTERAFTKRQFFGSRIQETFAYSITVRNTKAVPISILVEDQVPVSANAQIEIDADIQDEGTLDENTGIVQWRVNLPGSSSRTVSFRYTVTYPKGRTVRL